MRRTILVSLGALLAGPALFGAAPSPFAGGSVSAQVPEAVDSLQARVWLDRGDEPVVAEGDEVRVYYRTNADAYGAIFRIDTDGRVHLLFPQHPGADPFIGGERDYRLLFPESARWEVGDDPGVGYYFMIASREPLDFSLFDFDDDAGWDLGAVSPVVYEDPYVAIDDYVAALLPTWDVTPYALDFLEYSVDEEHDYPRFLCYDCHDFRGYGDWDPYADVCPSYQVVIWDDPYFRPSFRYSGNMVVVARPFGPRPRYGVTPRVRGAVWGPIVRKRAAPPRVVPVYKEPGRRPVLRRRAPQAAGQPVGGRRGVATGNPGRIAPTRPSGRVRPSPTSGRAGRMPAARSRPAAASRPNTGSRPNTALRRQPPTATARPRSPVRPPIASSGPPRGVERATPSRSPRGAVAPGRPRVRPSTQRPTTGSSRPPNARAKPAPPRRTPQRPVTRPAPRRPSGRSPAARPPRSGGASGNRAAAARPQRSPVRSPARSGAPRRRGGTPGG